MKTDAPLLLDSITDAGAQARDRIIVSGSHGGLYPAYLVSRAAVRAVILNDAGQGLARAGVAGVLALERVGLAAAAATHSSCRIGDATDMLEKGTISVANAIAHSLGIGAGMSVAEACENLSKAPQPHSALPEITESRRMLPLGDAARVVLADSASLVRPEDRGHVVITGSHGGLIGGDPARALKAAAALGVFNDAGYGCDGAGATRLPALEEAGIAAVTVAHHSARIGEAGSAWETGVISCANPAARAAGFKIGEPLTAAIRRIFQKRRSS